MRLNQRLNSLFNETVELGKDTAKFVGGFVALSGVVLGIGAAAHYTIRPCINAAFDVAEEPLNNLAKQAKHYFLPGMP